MAPNFIDNSAAPRPKDYTRPLRGVQSRKSGEAEEGANVPPRRRQQLKRNMLDPTRRRAD